MEVGERSAREVCAKGSMIKELVLLDLMQDDLARVEAKMRTVRDGAFAPLAEAFLRILGSGGKRLRPALALSAFAFSGEEISDKAVAVAAAVGLATPAPPAAIAAMVERIRVPRGAGEAHEISA